MHLFPSQSTSLPLGGLPGFFFTLCGALFLVRLTASSTSAFPLPFPLLAGERAERRVQRADPAAAGERYKETQLYSEWPEDGRQTDTVKKLT